MSTHRFVAARVAGIVDRLSVRRLSSLLGAAGCALSTACFVAPDASAYKRIDSRCILRAEEPYYGGGGQYVVAGEVDCHDYGFVESRIEVCAQVYNANGNWYTVSGSCKKSPWEYREINFEYNNVVGVNGHEYRTLDKAWLEDGAFAEYESSGFTCGCP